MFSFFKRKKTKNDVFTVAFYNVENLFDTKNNPNTLDDDFTPDGKKHWTHKRYRNKIKKLSSVISQLGTQKSFYTPAIVGLVEVENAKVVSDLISHPNLSKHHYGFVHYDSPDERGIDVALLYKKELFEYLSSETYTTYVENEEGERDYTRDVLLVKGKLKGELLYILVNHWPSRRDGAEETSYKRIKAAENVRNIISEIRKLDADARFIVMGDFNDDPTSASVKEYLVNDDFYNPMEALLDHDTHGTLTYDKNGIFLIKLF